MALSAVTILILAASLLLIVLSVLRLAYKSTATLLIVLGSGGHTAEMLRLLDSLNFAKYTHRRYVVSSGDTLSEGKARHFEQTKGKPVRLTFFPRLI